MKTENLTGHTQGKWKVVEMTKPLSSFYKSFWVQTDKFLISESEVKGGLTIEETEANANLIAAAPELLQENITLKAALNLQQKLYNAQNDSNRELLSALEFQNDLVTRCIKVMQDHCNPAGITDAEAISKIYDVLDNTEMVVKLRESQAILAKAKGETNS